MKDEKEQQINGMEQKKDKKPTKTAKKMFLGEKNYLGNRQNSKITKY